MRALARVCVRLGVVAAAVLWASALLPFLSPTAEAHPNVIISGTAFIDEAGTPWTTANGGGCDGSTQNIGISANGAASVSGSCDATTGAFSISVHTPDSDKPLVVYLNTNGGDRGATYTVNDTRSAGISGLSLTRNLVRVRSDSTAISKWTGFMLDVFDQDQDADVPLLAGPVNLTTPASIGFQLEAGNDMTGPTNVSVGSLQVDGSITTITQLTLTGSGTSTNCAADHGTQMPLCVTGTLAKPVTTTFAGTSATQVPNLPWNSLKLAPSGPGNPTYVLGTGPGQDITTDF
ncbi:MAG: hypothetical protein JWM90_1037, partial [Thermoleophilia bacterium]|nr:hypothetical protein [Thermoleophilia bacterium]